MTLLRRADALLRCAALVQAQDIGFDKRADAFVKCADASVRHAKDFDKCADGFDKHAKDFDKRADCFDKRALLWQAQDIRYLTVWNGSILPFIGFFFLWSACGFGFVVVLHALYIFE